MKIGSTLIVTALLFLSANGRADEPDVCGVYLAALMPDTTLDRVRLLGGLGDNGGQRGPLLTNHPENESRYYRITLPNGQQRYLLVRALSSAEALAQYKKQMDDLYEGNNNVREVRPFESRVVRPKHRVKHFLRNTGAYLTTGALVMTAYGVSSFLPSLIQFPVTVGTLAAAGIPAYFINRRLRIDAIQDAGYVVGFQNVDQEPVNIPIVRRSTPAPIDIRDHVAPLLQTTAGAPDVVTLGLRGTRPPVPEMLRILLGEPRDVQIETISLADLETGLTNFRRVPTPTLPSPVDPE